MEDKITITIASKGRRESLRRCINSIDVDARIIVLVTRPEDVDVDGIEVIIDSSLRPVQAQNVLMPMAKGHILPVSDDVEFENGSIQKALNVLDKNVVGFHTVNMTSSPYAFMLISSEYYKEFGGFYKEYKHFFADTEYGERASSIGRFNYCKEATLKHYHPSAGFIADETYKNARSNGIWNHDNEIYMRRNK